MVRYVTRQVHHGQVENDFPFQLYLRLYQDDVMYEMVNPLTDVAVCHGLTCGGALVCRFVADQYIVGYVEAGLDTNHGSYRLVHFDRPTPNW